MTDQGIGSIPAISTDAPVLTQRPSAGDFAEQLLKSMGESPDEPFNPAEAAVTPAAAPQAPVEKKEITAERVTIDSLGRPHDAETGKLLPKSVLDQSKPAAETPAPEAKTYEYKGQSLTEQDLADALAAKMERQTWISKTAEEVARLNAERTQLEQERSKVLRAQWEAEQAKREADGLKLLAAQNPEALAQFFQSDPAAPQQFQPRQEPVDPLQRPVTMGDLQRMQQAQIAQQKEASFYNTVQQTIEAGLPEAQLGVFTQRARAHVAAQLEMDRLANRIGPNMTPDQLKMVIGRYIGEEQGFYKTAIDKELGLRASKQKASTPPVTSQGGLTPMPTPSAQRDENWKFNRDPNAFLEGILANQQAMTASAGGNL